MKITSKTPNITQYRIDMERGDTYYHRCTWAHINLDNDTFTLTISSDCGDYSYRWCVEEDRPFKKLMACIDKEYLLNKIASRSYFNLDKSKELLLRDYRNSDLSEEQLQDLKNICDYSPEMYLNQVVEIIPQVEYCSIPMEMEYPAGARTIAEIFVEVLQPYIRKELLTG